MCEDPGPQEQEAPAILGKTVAAAKTLSPISAQSECHPSSGAAGPAPGPLPGPPSHSAGTFILLQVWPEGGCGAARLPGREGREGGESGG